jgi:competence protein ComEC
LTSGKKLLLAGIVCFFGAYLATDLRHPKVTFNEEAMVGTGIFHIDEVKPHSSFFHRSILYRGKLKSFQTHDAKSFHDLPCHIYLPLFGKHPSAHTDYEISGKLLQKGDYAFLLKPDKQKAWNPVDSSFNFSEWRFQAKNKISQLLKKEITDPSVRTFLNALSIGEIDERVLQMEFSKLGLQHILAISGFHFALAAFFLNFVFRLLFPLRVSAALLILFISFYYFFLGNAPSIQRAYIAILLVTCGQLFSLKISGLNALGAGLFVELAMDPLVITQLSFQLTFLCTLAILLFYPVIHRAISWALPERTYGQVKSMGVLDRYGYIFSALLRQALALNLAVHLISVPVVLYLFHKFPLLSIAYNLFFPACVSISMLLLFTALLFSPLLSFLSHWVHAINNTWTSALMTLTSHPPAYLDFTIRTKCISFSFVVFFLAISFFLGVIAFEKERTLKKSSL